MTFLDTSALVGALLEKHPQHAACLRALQEAANPVSDAHALAETFATLTGFYKVPSEAAAELTLGLRAVGPVMLGGEGLTYLVLRGLAHSGQGWPPDRPGQERPP